MFSKFVISNLDSDFRLVADFHDRGDFYLIIIANSEICKGFASEL